MNLILNIEIVFLITILIVWDIFTFVFVIRFVVVEHPVQMLINICINSRSTFSSASDTPGYDTSQSSCPVDVAN